MMKLLTDGVPSLAFPLHMFVRVALYTLIGGMGIMSVNPVPILVKTSD